MTEPKYYTPEIEEFCKGFEYEILVGDPHHNIDGSAKPFKWQKVKFPDPFVGWNADKIKDARVKLLDKEDIESEGWIFLSEKTDGWKHEKFSKESTPKYCSWELTLNKEREAQKDGLLVTNKEVIDTVVIKFYHPDDGKGAVIFSGKVKNKSEFKRLLKQLGII